MADRHDHHDHADDPADCGQVLEELYTYLDGELTDERRRLISTHLDDCNPCLEVFDFEAELRMVVQRRCQDQVPDGLRMRVEASLREISFHERDR
jgi:mycothiol system anti-sigma-R factor